MTAVEAEEAQVIAADPGNSDPPAIENTSSAIRADAAPPMAKTKRIIAFSDGTGNSSSKVFRTNVFRLYTALQLGDVTMPTPQVAYYDNGVGTSSVRIMALMGGVFGFGLKRNLFELYRYVCRNYNDGDEIFAFGFSRGAFTIRLLVALICEEGIVPYEDERELTRNCGDALRRFLSRNAPDSFPWLFRAIRSVRDRTIGLWRKAWDQPFNADAQFRPDIEFVGVWDTVAAYGGPISEITRGIDQYVWPLTMTDYALNAKVKRARHALALDDERDSFWPLLWDEVAEARRMLRMSDAERACEMDDPRLKQVWFAGMHSDVGGGYPDDSLSYVSLRWMIAEIGQRLTFIPEECNHVAQFANPLGPMHDSRAGLAAYYRYQPRKISAMLHKSVPDVVAFDETRVLRDPIIGEKQYRPQGLLLRCLIHRSVIERIAVGNDNYAPIVLPQDFDVDETEPAHSPEIQMAIANLEDPAIAEPRAQAQENAWDLVWLRRVCYFVIVALTLLLAAAPLRQSGILTDWNPGYVLFDWISGLFGWLGQFVPGFARPWYDQLTKSWFDTMIWAAVLGLLAMVMAGIESNLRDRQRVQWWAAIGALPVEPSLPTRLRRFRTGPGYQQRLQFWKWKAMPFITGVGTLLLGLYLLLLAGAQGYLYFKETRGDFCNSGLATPAELNLLDASKPCLRLLDAQGNGNALVHKGQDYYLEIDRSVAIPATGGNPGAARGTWTDGRVTGVPTTGLATFAAPGFSQPFMAAGAGLRRVATAKWLEPVVELRRPRRYDRTFHYRDARMLRLRFLDDSPCAAASALVIGTFTADRDGEVYLFLNDAWAPGSSEYFYKGSKWSRNVGTARVRLFDAQSFAEREDKCRELRHNYGRGSDRQ